MIIAAFLAVMLGIGLGYASYSFIMETKMVQEKPSVKTLDLHTQRGGLGVDGVGGIFEQNETVQFSAFVAADGLPINETEVNFTIRNPDEDEVAESALTDASGTAKVKITLPIEEPAIGNWSVTAVAHVENETVSDSLVFVCEASVPVRRILDLYTQDGGLGVNQSGGFFGPRALVQLFAYLTADGFPINQTEVAFKVSDPAGNETAKLALTDNSGIANVNLALPVEESAFGNWSVTAVAHVENETLSDSLLFVCRIASTPIVMVKTLDVYTQRGGLGINLSESGGIFEQGEVVQLFAYLTVGGLPINETEVTFTVKDPSGNETAESALTDSSGKAKINFTLPSDESALGNWSILAIAHVDNETVSDSVAFGCEESVSVRRTLDLYTQRGGLGPDELGGFFGPGEVVQFFAYLTGDGVPINQTEVAFTICQYGGSPVTESALTDDLGIAKVNFTIPSGSSSQGNWSVSAVAYVENEAVNDSLFFGCMTVTASMLVVTKRNGDLTVNFAPLDYVTVEAHVYCELDLLPVELAFQVSDANGHIRIEQSVSTDPLGDAFIGFQMLLPEDGIIGYWHAYVSFQAYGRLVEAHVVFECQVPPIEFDVYTQRGGFGQNIQSGPFSLGENASLYAAIRNMLNASLIVDKLVSFEVRLPNGTVLMTLTGQTDSTGIASVSFQIPTDLSLVGPWEVYARTEFYGSVLLDTLVFVAEQPPPEWNPQPSVGNAA